MFESLSDRLTGALSGLRGKGRLTEADVDATAREIRLALLEADVSLPVVREFVGHGTGPIFHMKPNVPHYYDPKHRFEIVPGMTFTIEPMINVGNWRAQMWDDDWTATSVDLSHSAQFEHTLVVHEDGVEILTIGEHEPQPFMAGQDRSVWPSTLPTAEGVAV